MAHLEERRLKAENEVQELEDEIASIVEKTETLTAKLKVESVLEKKVKEEYLEAKKKRDEEQ